MPRSVHTAVVPGSARFGSLVRPVSGSGILGTLVTAEYGVLSPQTMDYVQRNLWILQIDLKGGCVMAGRLSGGPARDRKVHIAGEAR